MQPTTNPKNTSNSDGNRRRVTLVLHRDIPRTMRAVFPLRELNDPTEKAIHDFSAKRYPISGHGEMTLTIKQWRENLAGLRGYYEANHDRDGTRAGTTYAILKNKLEQAIGREVVIPSSIRRIRRAA